MKYHYVVFGCKEEYFSIMFKDAVDKLGVEYIANPIVYNRYNWILRCLYSIHHYEYFNWPKELPLKKLWYPLYYNKKQYKPICFVFMMDWCKGKYVPLFDLLRSRYPECKLVLYLEDIVASRKGEFEFPLLKYFDKVVTFDKGDSEKYDFLYCPTFMSKLDIPEDDTNKSDACYWGEDKGRSTIINGVYKKLTDNGMVCNFLVAKKGKDTRLEEGIKVSKHGKPYSTYLSAVANTDVIVEIMNKNAVGFTLRTWEALLYNKVLLTNNQSIVESPYYNPEQMVVFDNTEEIDIEHIKRGIGKMPRFDETKVSPVIFFNYLEEKLS